MLLNIFFISSVWTITMIIYFLYGVVSSVGLDVFITVIRYFRYRTRTMMYSGFWNYRIIHWSSFSLNFLYWSLYSLCLDVAPTTATKTSTSSLKFQIDDLCDGRLKRPLHPPIPWGPLLPPQPPRPLSRPLLLLLDYLVFLWPLVVVASPSPPLLPTAGGDVSVSGVIKFFLNNVELTLLFYF